MTDTRRPEKRVLLLTLSERTSERGTTWLSGWLGKARLVGFKSRSLDKFGHEQWEIYACEPREQPQQDRGDPPTRERPPAEAMSPRDRENYVETLAAKFRPDDPDDL